MVKAPRLPPALQSCVPSGLALTIMRPASAPSPRKTSAWQDVYHAETAFGTAYIKITS
jgi:hypothetical protein